jgi:integrase
VSWLEKLDSGRVRAVYRDETGKRRSRTFDRRAEAKAWLAAEATDRARGQWVDPRGGTVLFSTWAEQWLAARLVRPTTLASDHARYANHLAPAFGAVPLREISPLRVKAYIAELAARRAPATVRHVHALLSSILSAAVDEGLLLHNPCRRTSLPRSSPPPQTFLSPDEIARLAGVIDPHYRQLVITAAGTGLRWGELVGLSPAAVDLLHGRLYVDRTLVDINGALSFGEPKTRGSRRVVSLSRTLVDGLTEQLSRATTQLMFPSPTGEPLRRSNFYHRTWRPAVRAAGFAPAPRFHDLRHSHVAMLIAAGVPVKAIQERLGHASIVMTMDRYGHLLQTVDATLLEAVDAGLRASRVAEPDGPATTTGDETLPQAPAGSRPWPAQGTSRGPGGSAPR